MEWIKKNKKVVIAVSVVVVLLIVGLVIILLGNGVKQTKDTITVEAGEELNLKATDFLDISDKKAEKVELDTSDVNVDKVGDYEVVAKYGKKEYIVKLVVEDTTAPQVTMKDHIVYTSDMTTVTADEDIDLVYDASKHETTFVGFEKIGDLSVVNDEYVAELEKGISKEPSVENLATEVPTEEGIYRSVLSFKDEHGNETLVEVYVVYDAPDPVVETPAEPETTQNIGSTTTSNNSGNKNTTSNKNTNSGTTTNNGNSGSTSNNTNSGSTSSNQSTGSGQTNSTGKALSPAQQAAVNAGYYNVATSSDGYSVMVKSHDEAEKGRQILRDYLATLGYEMYNGGGAGAWIDNLNGQYGIYVRYDQIRKIQDPNDTSDVRW